MCKSNALRNLIKQKSDDDYTIIDHIYLYVQVPNEAKYHYLIKKTRKNGLKNLKDSKAFIGSSNNMQNVYKNIEDYNPGRKCNGLIVFD